MVGRQSSRELVHIEETPSQRWLAEATYSRGHVLERVVLCACLARDDLIDPVAPDPASLAPRIPDIPRGMDQKMTALERAFQLARSGSVAGLTEIVASLNREGYSANQIEGRLLKRQLADLIKAARKTTVDSAPT